MPLQASIKDTIRVWIIYLTLEWAKYWNEIPKKKLKVVLDTAGVRLIQPQFWEKVLSRLDKVALGFYSIPNNSEAATVRTIKRQWIPMTGEQPKRRPYANPVKLDTMYFISENEDEEIESTRCSRRLINQPESWARIETKLAQTRHQVRGRPYRFNIISDVIPAVIRPTQLDNETIETCPACNFESAVARSCVTPRSVNRASAQCPTFCL